MKVSFTPFSSSTPDSHLEATPINARLRPSRTENYNYLLAEPSGSDTLHPAVGHVLYADCKSTIVEVRHMGGLVAFIFLGYMLHRTRGHWAEIVVFSVTASVLWWAIRVARGIFLAVFGVLLLAFLVTR